MALYLNELAPWEEKSQYLSQVQLGKDVKQQIKIIEDGVNAQIESQLTSTNAVIASQDRIAEGIGNLAVGIDNISNGIQDLKASFEIGISEVIWQIEQNSKVLKGIIEVLQSPLDTQAKERKKRADEAFANGWINDAEEEYLESEKLNKFDFSIHISLGIIYLFNIIDKKKALEYFQKAAKYALPKSNFYTSFALIYQALAHRSFDEIEEAEKLTDEATKLTPDFGEAWYQNAVYNEILGNKEKFLKSLVNSILIDRGFCLKAEKDFKGSSLQDVCDMVMGLKNYETQQVEKLYKAILKEYGTYLEILEKIFDNAMAYPCDIFVGNPIDLPHLKGQLPEVNKVKIDSLLDSLLSRDSYFDILDAKIYLKQLQKNLASHNCEAHEYSKIMLEKFNATLKTIKNDGKTIRAVRNLDDFNDSLGPIAFLSGVAAWLVIGIDFDGWLGFAAFLMLVILPQIIHANFKAKIIASTISKLEEHASQQHTLNQKLKHIVF